MAAVADSKSQGRVAVIGAGVSGIAVANVWQACGYEVIVYEASNRIGGQWTRTYPGVSLQNTAPQYQFAEFPWPFQPDRHPTGEQVLRYLEAAVVAFSLDVRLEHPITAMVEEDSGWRLTVANRDEHFDHVVIATGQYPGGSGKYIPPFPGRETYQGEVVTNISSRDLFKGKRVAVVGFGKTALDFASWSAPLATETVHVFRTPRWTIPDYLLGIDYTRPFFARFGSDMMPSWCYSSPPQKILHGPLKFVVDGFWSFIATLFRFQHRRDARRGGADLRALDAVIPPKSQFLSDLRSATALAPPDYFAQVAKGEVRPVRAAVDRFDETGLVLSNGDRVEADLICVCCGNAAPTYPFLSDAHRALLEGPPGGPALYRHIVHPALKNVSFAGYNHGFMHIALCEVGAVWAVAAHRGDLRLPDEAEMRASAERVAQWKRDHSAFEPTANLAVNTRYQQHLDMLLQDLGISQWRKLPNLPAEIFARYDPTDYAGVTRTYLDQSARRRAKGAVLTPSASDI